MALHSILSMLATGLALASFTTTSTAKTIITATVEESTDQLITDYVTKHRQRFFVVDPTVHEAVALFEDPHAQLESISRVYWVCTPQHAPNRMVPSSVGSDGRIHFDNVVAHGLVYSIDTGIVSPHGYVATREGDTYEEFFIGYDNHSIQQIKLDTYRSGSVISGVGSSGSPAYGRSGVLFSGRGEWVTDVEDPRLVAMSQVLGIALTQENCDSYYAHAWDKAHAGIIAESSGIGLEREHFDDGETDVERQLYDVKDEDADMMDDSASPVAASLTLWDVALVFFAGATLVL